MRKKQKKESNLKIVIVFCLLVFFLITCSLLIRFFSILNKSYFDGEHRFTISVYGNLLSDNLVLSFSPETNSISYLKLKNFKNKDNIGEVLKIPIDGNINFFEKNSFDEKDIEFILRSSIFEINSTETNLTFVDLLRLWYFTKTLPSHAITYEEKKDLFKEEINQEYSIDKLSSKLFLDYTLSQEKLAIQIINGANVAGLGNRLARFISNSGGNVISVLTSDKELQQSTIEYFGEVSYTHKRLQKILGFSLKEGKNPSISDIVIIIGKDSENNSIF